MEVLAALHAPFALQHAYAALTIAWQQYAAVQGHKEQCKLLIQRCQDLLVEVCHQMKLDAGSDVGSSRQDLLALESACLAVKDTIKNLSGKSFTWRLLHQDKMTYSLAAVETAVIDAFMTFNLGAHLNARRLQIEIAEAQKQDKLDLVAHLDGLAENDQKILNALQADGRGRRRLEELVIALTKHVRNLTPTADNRDEPADAFIRTATTTLQRLSKQPTPEIPHWCVTSLEVVFDPDDEECCVGRGGFGNIYKGEWNGQVVAVKEMYSEDARLLDRQNLKTITHEIKIWSRLAHPHVLPFYCACLEASKPFMVSRFCQNGNALEYLRAYPDADRICMLHEISLGMTYLHGQAVIHSDLKGSNILIGDDGKALIADFGLSHLQDQVASTASRSRASAQRQNGTLRWMAPELLDGEKLDKPADVYSFALLAWELYTGCVPFANIPERAFARRVVDKQERPDRPPTMSDVLWALIQRCWSPEPATRPVFGTIQHRLRPLMAPALSQSPLSISSRAPSDLFASLQLVDVETNTSVSSTSDDSVDKPPPYVSTPRLTTHKSLGNPRGPQVPVYTDKPLPHISAPRLTAHRSLRTPRDAQVPIPTPTPVPVLHAHIDPFLNLGSDCVTSCALDEEWIVVGLTTNTILVFSAISGEFCHALLGHEMGVWDVKLISRGGFWGERYVDPVIAEVWERIAPTAVPLPMRDALGLGVNPATNGDGRGRQGDPIGKPSSLTGSSEGWGQPNSLLVSGGSDKVIRVWDVQSGYCIYTLAGHSSTIRCIRMLHNRPIAVTGSRDATLRVWNIQRGQLLRVLEGHEHGVRCMDVCGNRAVSGSYDTTCRVWDVDSGVCLHVLRGHTLQIFSVAFDGVRIASGGEDATVCIWNSLTGQCLTRIQEHASIVGRLHLTSALLVSGGVDGRVVVFSFSTNTVVRRIPAHESAIISLQLDQQHVVTGSNDGRVKLFETTTGKYVRDLGNPGEATESAWKFIRGKDMWVIICRRAGRTVMEIWSRKKTSTGRNADLW